MTYTNEITMVSIGIEYGIHTPKMPHSSKSQKYDNFAPYLLLHFFGFLRKKESVTMCLFNLSDHSLV